MAGNQLENRTTSRKDYYCKVRVFYGFIRESGTVAGKFSPAIGLDVPHCLGMGAVNRARVRVFYSGRVQGVGFRYTTRTTATGFELSGVVRNLPDGRVELVAEGLRAELEAFLLAIRESGLGHFIESETVDWGEAKNEFRGFEIVK